jgi:hypothetical protein
MPTDEIKKLKKVMQEAQQARQELTAEFRRSVRSHRKNGKLLRDLYEQGKEAKAGKRGEGAT